MAEFNKKIGLMNAERIVNGLQIIEPTEFPTAPSMPFKQIFISKHIIRS
jgi:hypothetical protein